MSTAQSPEHRAESEHDVSDDFKDFFEGGSGVPGITFNGKKKGAKITGVLVPQVGKAGNEVTHKTTQQTDFRTKEPKIWKDGSPMLQAELLLITEGLPTWDFCSDNFIENVDEGTEDDGLRRLFVRGKGLEPKFKKAVRKAGGLRVGQTITVTLTKVVVLEDGKQLDFEVEIADPTPETVTKARQAAPADPSEPDALADTAGGGGEAASEDEPPF